ncbi:MAG: 4-hydroxythreonine-4-phosphate dehydrogenase PdxA, partial [Kiloniellales bacterium]|nr:4-hydroxythreonine-4-phosphate dehydrogenase PdxA [Kiloniellales bacterium]
MKPTIALVQGDATGIGPELMAKLLAEPETRERANILIVADRRVFEAGCAVAEQDIEARRIVDIADSDFSDSRPNLLDLDCLDPATVTPGQVSEAAGRTVLLGFGKALDLAKAGQVDGVCFMPFNKEALHRAGIDQEDELQWAKARLGSTALASEFNVIEGMWNARVTSHVPLRDVADRLSEAGIVAAVRLADRTLREAGFERPRIAVAALNPHAGDGGAIGREEIEIIRPAVEQAKRLQIAVEGPFPSDTLYIKVRDGLYDCAVSMYHDQGQIAIKLLGFHMGVSVLGGLPVPVTTPAHGTAFDIVGRNRANVEPARRAFLMAV